MISQIKKTTNPTLQRIFDVLEVAQIIPEFLTREMLTNITEYYKIRDFESLFLQLGDLEKFPCFLILRHELDDVIYFRLLGQVLVSECYATDFPDLVRALLIERPFSSRNHLMDESERTRLLELPTEIIIYRGTALSSKRGFSWTPSQNNALFFAKRHLNLNNDAIILQGVCQKSDIIAYFKKEEEIFILPENVKEKEPLQQLPGNRINKVIMTPKYRTYLKIKKYLLSKQKTFFSSSKTTE